MKFEGSAGGGMVTIIMTGEHEVLSVKIDPSIVSSQNTGMLEDLIRSAISDAFRKAQKETEQLFSGMMGGMGGFGYITLLVVLVDLVLLGIWLWKQIQK